MSKEAGIPKTLRKEIIMKKFVLLICLLGLIFANGGLALAEEKEEEAEVIKLEDVVVTATRTERKIKDVPATVTVITREEIEKSSATSAFDLLRTVPGMCIEDSYGIGMQGRVSLRAFNPFGSEYVLVLVDGIPVNEGDDGDVSWGGSVPPPEDIERIEVVKGPTSALYGGNAMGGVIHIITKSGHLEPYTKIASSFGSDAAMKGEVSTGGTTKNLSYRFGATYLEGDGWRDHNDHDKKNFFAKVSVAPDEESDLTFNLFYSDLFYELAGGLTEAEYEADPRQSVRPYDSVDIQAFRLSSTYQRDIDKYNEVKTSVWAFRKKYDDYMDFGGVKEYISDISTLGVEVQHNLKYDLLGKPNSLLLGVNLKGDEIDYQKFNAPGGIRSGNPTDDNNTKGVSYALFIQDEFTVFAPLTITLGARYDKIEYDYTDYLDGTKSGDKSFDRVSPKFGIVYRFSDMLNMFGNVGQAFKAPSCGDLFAGSSANPDLDPELATNYEIGFNAQLLDKLSFKLSGYWMDVEDEIITISLGGGKYEYQNAGETRRKGVESELGLEILKGLTAFANLNYQEAEFTDYTDKYGTYDGNRVPHAPDWRISSGIRYDHRVGLTLNLGMNWVDDQYSDRKNTYEIPSYTVWNTRLDFERNWWSLYFLVNNLFDEEYYENRTSSGKIYPSPERAFMSGVSIKF